MIALHHPGKRVVKIKIVENEEHMGKRTLLQTDIFLSYVKSTSN